MSKSYQHFIIGFLIISSLCSVTDKQAFASSSKPVTRITTSSPARASSKKEPVNSGLFKVTHKFVGKYFVNYQTQIRQKSRVNYKIYASGGYNVSTKDKKPINYSKQYRGKLVTVTGQEIVKDPIYGTRTWNRIKIENRQVGWIVKNALDNSQRRLVGVPLIAQRPQLPTGCEITAVSMMLNYAGDHATKTQLANEMPRSSNPNKGFVGSPYSKSGWYIYPKGLMPLVKRHLGSVKNLTNSGLYSLRKSIDRNHPVVIWLAPLDGFPNHALTVTGYSKNYFYLNDPWLKKRIVMSNKRIRKLWSNDHNRALSY